MMCASTVQVTALPGVVVSNTGIIQKEPLPQQESILAVGRFLIRCFDLGNMMIRTDMVIIFLRSISEIIHRTAHRSMGDPSRKGGTDMNKYTMFDQYPDVVEVDDLRKMLGGISKKLAYRLLTEQEIRSVKVGRAYKIPKVCVIEYLMGEEICHIKLS